MMAGGAPLSVATRRARPGLRAALQMAVAVRVAGCGPPSRCPTARASAVVVAMAAATRHPAPTTGRQMLTSTRRSRTISSTPPSRRSRGSSHAAARGVEPSHDHAEREREQLRHENLPRKLEWIAHGSGTVIFVEHPDEERHRHHGEDHHRDLQRGREGAVSARIERSAQRHRRAGRDRHQHDADFRRARDRPKALRHDECEHRHRDQHREQPLQDQGRMAHDPAEFAGHEREAQVEHHGEQRGRGGDGEHRPWRSGRLSALDPPFRSHDDARPTQVGGKCRWPPLQIIRIFAPRCFVVAAGRGQSAVLHS